VDEGLKRLIELGVNATPALSELDKVSGAAKKAGDDVGGVQGQLTNFADTLKGVFAGLGIAELAKQAVEGFFSMVDAIDQMGKSAQQLGVTVEKAQELQYALSFAGLKDGDSIAMLGRLSDKLADIGDTSNDTSRKLREMGIAAGDDVETAIKKMADVFANAPDGIDKTALAIEIFGKKVGLQMVPYLNDGADAIEAAMKQAGAFGEVSAETAKQAADFNDNMARLSKAMQAIGYVIAEYLLPPLSSTVEWIVKNIDEIKKWGGLIIKITSPVFTLASAVTTLKNAFSGSVEVATDGVNTFAGAAKAYEEAAAKAGKTGVIPGAQSDLDKAADSAKKAADKFALLPKEIDRLRTEMGKLDPTVGDNALVIESYNRQIDAMQKTLDGATPKAAKHAKAVKEVKTEYDKWVESMMKAQTQTDDSGKEIAWLQQNLAALAATGDTSSVAFQKWSKELRTLQPDALADALDKINKSAKEFETAPGIITGMQMALEGLEGAGKGASEQAVLLRKEIEKLKESQDPTGATKAVQNIKDAMEAGQNLQAQIDAINKAMDAGDIPTAWGEAAKNKLLQIGDTAKTTKTDVETLGESILKASSQFVTNFVDSAIEGFGKTKASFSDMVTDMIKMIAKLIVQWEIAAALKSAGGTDGILAAFTGTKAKGGAWNASGIEYMATGGIIGGPTFFSNRGRLTVAGEAGPEAVVPLQRSASGDLGVAASPVTVNVHNNSSAEVATTSKDNSDGSRQIDIYIEQKVKSMLTSGTLDRTMRTSYGVGRQPAAG